MESALHLLNSIKHGGAESVAVNYALILEKMNIRSTIVAQPFSDDFEEFIKSKYIVVKYTLNKDDIKKASYLFIHSNQKLVSVFRYFFIIKFLKKRVFYIQHLNYSRAKFFLLSILINMVCTDFIRITPITENLVEKYIRVRKHFLVNFYLLKYDKSEYPEIRRSIRCEHGIEEDVKVFIFTGVLKDGKGIEDFLFIAEYFSSHEDYCFLIVGDGPLAYLVKEKNLENVRWMGFQNDVEKYLIASDVYLFLSKKEMLPMALIEAINTGRDIMAYDIEVNNFLLNNETCNTPECMIKSILDGKYPKCLRKYDIAYAMAAIKGMLAK